jgi:hypothetical protein
VEQAARGLDRPLVAGREGGRGYAARAGPTAVCRRKWGAAMTEAATGWELGEDGRHFSIPIWPRDLDSVREWCRENCLGDFMVVLDRRVVFARREDAALATLFWRAEGD